MPENAVLKVERMLYTFAVEQVADVEIGVLARVMLGGGEDDVVPPERFQGVVVVQVGQVIDGVGEINILIVKTVHKRLDVVRPAHANQLAELPRLLEHKIHRVVRPEARAGCHDKVMARVITDERQHFVNNIGFVLLMPPDSGEGIDVFVVQAFAVNRVYADKLVVAML